MDYFYDEKGDLIYFKLTNSTYPSGADFYYIRNGQNDITGILDSSGYQVVTYTYDSWGKLLSTTGTLASTVGVKNPYRYRGYRYDVETGLYYLNSRYYNPELGRFINADAQINTGAGFNGMNLFSYCGNNPVMFEDESGQCFMLVAGLVGAVVGAVVGGAIAYANSGGDWNEVAKGALIGAAVGGLIGLTCGAVAGVALAGSATATTAAVIAGGSELIAAVASGGVAAGGKMIADNASRAVNSGGGQVVANKMAEVTSKGKAGEEMSGLIKNTQRIEALVSNAKFRIPDGLTDNVLSEVKNYSGTLSYTKQLQDFVAYSQSNGFAMHLYTNARLTGPLQQMVDSGAIQLFPLG